MKQRSLNRDPPGTQEQETVSIQWKIIYCMVMCPALFFQVKSPGHECYTKWVGAWEILLCSTDQPKGRDSKNRGPARFIGVLAQWHPTPVLLPGKSHGWRSLVGCSPWGRKGSDTTERLPFHFSLSCIGEGNGNPLWRSCLESPRDEGAYGVAQSRTRLKWLSSRSRL